MFRENCSKKINLKQYKWWGWGGKNRILKSEDEVAENSSFATQLKPSNLKLGEKTLLHSAAKILLLHFSIYCIFICIHSFAAATMTQD